MNPACLACSHRSIYGPVEGDGPQPARVMFVGEGPAKEEDRRRRVFAGRSGRELDLQYLPLSGLCRPEVYVTNIKKCSCPGYRNPEVDEAAWCARHWLPREVRYTQPDIIVTLGGVACEVLFPDCDLQLEHGLPRAATLWNGEWTGTHVAMFHPAAGMRQPEKFMIPLQQDFARLREIQRGTWVSPVDEYPNPQYEEVQDLGRLSEHLFLCRLWGNVLAMDTEVARMETRTPWCLSASYAPGTGWMIPADRPELVAKLGEFIRDYRPLVVLHNALFDLDILERMFGFVVPRFDDTMVRAYHLGNLPQGLKALAYRLLGMRMQEFTDLVAPYARGLVADWLKLSLAILEPQVQAPVKPKLRRRPTKKELTQYDGSLADALLEDWQMERAVMTQDHERVVRDHKANPLVTPTKLLRRLAADLEKDTAAGTLKVNPWQRWTDWGDREDGAQGILTKVLGGRMPLPSITQVPRDKAVHYACRDADATIRLLGLLRKMQGEFRRRVGA